MTAQRAGERLHSRAGSGLVAGVVLLLALLVWAMRSTGLHGDEYTYATDARALGDWIAGRGGNAGAVFAEVVGNGWFMPGMAVLGAPLHALLPDPAPWQMQLYMAGVNGALLGALYAALRPVIGERRVWLLLVFPALAPLWWIGALAFLPDLAAGLLLAIAMALACRIALAGLAGERPDWRLIAPIELALIAALYLRGPMLIAGLGVHAVLLAVLLGRSWRRGLPVLAGLAAFLAALAPWSVAASQHFGATVITTTNVPLVLADSFGDPVRACFEPCPPGNDIEPAYAFAKAEAARSGQHLFAVQRAMMEHSLEGLTLRGYLAEVREHFGRFVLDPGGWLARKLPVAYGVPEDWRAAFYWAVLSASLLLYAPFILALAAVNLVPIRSSDSLRIQAVMIKAMTACVFLQPFVHKTSARYWIGFAALASWAAALLWAHWQARQSPIPAARRALPGWLDHAQVAYGMGAGLLMIAIVLA
jgi:hypothetical protein